jgi:hypothetical protein
MRALLLLLVVGLVLPVAAQTTLQPSGTVSISTTSVALGVGVNWGEGTLNAGGKRYTFTVQGLEVGAVGVSNVQATGNVYHLGTVENFEGTYVAVTGDAAIGTGAGVLTMRNQHGVVVNLQSTQQGVKLTAGAEGISVKLKR